MISVTRLNQSEVIVNADLIEFVEALPDTYITLVTGKKLMVAESPAEIVQRVLAYRQLAGSLLRSHVRPECLVHYEHEE